MGSGSGVIDFWRRQKLWCVSGGGGAARGVGRARERIDRKPAFQIESRRHNCSGPALGAVPDGGGLARRVLRGAGAPERAGTMAERPSHP